MLTALFVILTPAATGFVTFSMTWSADCRDTSGASCVPFAELGFGAAIGAATFVWMAERLRRGQDWVVDVAAILVSLGLWAAAMLPVLATVCRDLAVDEVCHDGLVAGLLLVPVSVAIGHFVGRRAMNGV